MKATHRDFGFIDLVSRARILSEIFMLVALLVVAGCGKKDPAESSGASSKATAKAGVSIEQPAEAPPPPAPDAPPATVAEGSTQPAPNGAGLSAEARKKRNLEWLRILKTGSEQQKAQVQEQFTHLPSEQLEEISELYQKQEKLK